MIEALHGEALPVWLLDILHRHGTVILAIDDDRNVVSCVVGAEALGFSSASIIGVDAATLVSASNKTEFMEACQRDAQAQEKRSFLVERKDVTGVSRSWLGSLYRQENDCDCLWYVLQDVTHVVAHPHVIGAHVKLSALRDLSGAVSHHLNNVIGGAMTSIDFALSSRDEHRMVKTLMQASQLMVKAGSIISGLRIFAVGDQHPQELCGFSDIVNDTIDAMAEVLVTAQVHVINHISSEVDVPVGRQQLTTVLRNLLNNAVEATPKGGTIQVRATSQTQGVVLQIVDEGFGIDTEVLSHIFEPFWTTKEQFTTDAGEGTGLGLAIVHGIVTSIGGTIQVESPAKGGTHVSVYWPAIPGG